MKGGINMNFLKNRKGLSDVITTVLIILLVLAAVILIWAFIRRPLEQGGQQIEIQGACLRLGDAIVPTACVIDTSDNVAKITVRRTGGDDITLNGVKVLATASTGANKINDSTAYPDVLGTKDYSITLTGFGTTETFTASVAAVISAGGKTGTCQESLTKISCSRVD